MSFIIYLAKTASCLNPIVYAVSHPKFRTEMAKELPCFGIGEKPRDNATLTEATQARDCEYLTNINFGNKTKKFKL